MAFLASAGPCSEVGLKLLLSPLTSTVVTRTACYVVGIGLPVYSTFKAIELKDQNEQEKWLVYWAAYGTFSIVELFSDKILSWFPYYYAAKFAFLVWLQFPSNNSGSKRIYLNYLRPYLLKHQAKIDRLLNILWGEMTNFLSSHREEIQTIQGIAGRLQATAQYVASGEERQAIDTARSLLLTEEAHNSDDEIDN